MERTKYIYFFSGVSRGSFTLHIGIYKSWVDLARENNLNICMLTVLDIRKYLKEKDSISMYKKVKYIRILISPHPKFNKILVFLYILFISLFNTRIVVHLRKQDPNIIYLLKRILGNKIQHIIEIEGDFESEIEYLSEHPYKPGFYDEFINSAKKAVKELPRQLKNADKILVVTENLKNLFVSRYPNINLKDKIYVLPTGADTKKFYFDEKLRKGIRRKLHLERKFVVVYTGNVYYSWQNLKRTLEIFKLIKENVKEIEPFLILLIRRQDFTIANEFIEKVGLDCKDFILSNITHDEVNAYLNASDVGILLRDYHKMNQVSSPGKIGEYLISGLPVLISKGIANYSEKVHNSGFGVVLNDIYDNTEVLAKINYLFSDNLREKRSIWAQSIFAVQTYNKTYLSVLRQYPENGINS